MQGPLLGFLDIHSAEKDIFQRDLEKEFNIRRSTATVMLQNLEQGITPEEKEFFLRIADKIMKNLE